MPAMERVPGQDEGSLLGTIRGVFRGRPMIGYRGSFASEQSSHCH